MQKKHNDEIHKINYLNTELDALYHQLSLKLGITNTISMILYSIYNLGDNCLLSDIYKTSGISKQTINSAIRSLEADEILYLEKHDGRSKKIVLTDKGKEYLKKTAAKVNKAEVAAFDLWTEEEINTYIGLMEKYVDSFRKQIEKL